MEKFKLITSIDRINYLSDNFIKYYKNFFNDEEFYFLVNSFNIVKLRPYLKSHGFIDSQIQEYNSRRFGWGDIINLQNATKTKWLNDGYIVVYADIDERIYHPQLKNYIKENLKNWIIPTGISLMQHDSEPPLDETKLMLEQRSYGKLDIYWFSKTCILKEDFKWLPGRHTKPKPNLEDSNIYLVDTGKMCKDFMLKNNAESKKIYDDLFWRYSTNDKKQFKAVYEEHTGPLLPLPKIIKECLLF